MDFYNKKNLWKFILLLFAILIGAVTLWYTESFLEELRIEEEKKVQQFAMAMRNVLEADPEDNFNFEQDFIRSNTTIPIVLTDASGALITARNMDLEKVQNPEWLQRKIEQMRQEAEPIEVVVSESQVQYIYYQNSILLTKLRYYPLILLLVISLFIGIAYIAFSNARKSEQNRVWNGLAKETAHQIGTPLSSLMGWIELLRAQQGTEEAVMEMEKDVERLNIITDRFSKIGSVPVLRPLNLVAVTEQAVGYLSSRSPRKVIFKTHFSPESKEVLVKLNKPLYAWVIENLLRNAVDAIGAKGQIDISIKVQNRNIVVEVADDGKGIAVNKQKTIFRPGFTTKKRGWGLGLSLARRIIEEYHQGKIFVAHSEVDKGTIFRILLRKAN